MSEKEIFKVYYHEIENEKEKYRVYYSYDARAKDAIEQLETMLKKKLYIYDIFPNFDEEKKKLTTPIDYVKLEDGRQVLILSENLTDYLIKEKVIDG